ncbi:MAG: succinylglutamate desuccinylase/aspartoacylase family protein [Candidatus Cybelea sp.]
MTERRRTYRELARRWEALDARMEDGLLCLDAGDPRLPRVAIATGLHGDEPAGPWALLELIETNALDPRFAYRLWPCVNPSGFELQTRENAARIDVNRTFAGAGASPEAAAVLAANSGQHFVLSLDLHEDCDARGFYCYEYGGGEIGRCVIAALDDAGFPIEPLDGALILAGPAEDEHYRCERGRAVADAVAEAGAIAGVSYTMALAAAAQHALTFETPSKYSWRRRLAMQRVAVLAAIAALF